MKSETVIRKIIAQIETYSTNMTKLLEELDESVKKENIKLKEDVAKKIATSFDLDLEQVLQKVIKKKILKQNRSLYENIIENNEDKNYIPIYTKIIFENNEYFYEDKPDGIVIQRDGTHTKIVGYITEQKTIKFI